LRVPIRDVLQQQAHVLGARTHSLLAVCKVFLQRAAPAVLAGKDLVYEVHRAAGLVAARVLEEAVVH